MIVLALDTSTPTVTAGVVRLRRPNELIAEPGLRPVELLAERVVVDAFAHAEQLMPLATAALAGADLDLAGVEAVVIGLGPGPFTGLRVGIASAAALGDALDVPVHGVSSHDAMAATLPASPGTVLVVTDARRREVYASAFVDGRLRFGPAVVAPIAVIGDLAAVGLTPTALAGAGVGLVEQLPGLAGLPHLRPVEALTTGLVTRALGALLTGAVPGPLTPLYLRRPDATEPAPRPKLG